MPARGFFERGHGVTTAPVVRVAVGFGRGLVVGTTAIIDTGSDLCVFPPALFPWETATIGAPAVPVELADATVVHAPLRYPSVTAGDIRETAVASALLSGSPPILGRSFLNRVGVRIAAPIGLVRLHRVRPVHP